MSGRPPPFLAALGLEDAEGLDERALRRGYARRLKQIDIEADPAAFQALREALEHAQRWLAWQQRQRAEAAVETPVEPASPAEVVPAPAPARASVPVDAPPPAPAAPASAPSARALVESSADAVFADLSARLAAGVAGEAAVTALLERALQDERLAAIDTRLHFEWRVARLLAQGWQPGLEFVLDPATQAFAWERDHARLGTFGPVGARIAAAIRERTAFHQLPLPQRQPLLEMMRHLRSGTPASDREVSEQMPRLDALVKRFPNWLGIMTPAAHVNARIDAWNRLQRARPAAPPKLPAKQGLGVGTLVWMAILVIGSLLRLAAPGSAPRDPFRQPLAAEAAPQQRLDEDLERRQRQAEALLQRILDAGAASQPAPGSAGHPAAPAPRPRYDPSVGMPFDAGVTFEQQSGGAR